MSSNPCNASGLSNILAALKGSKDYSTTQVKAISNIANQARSVAVAANSGNVGFAATMSGEIIRGLQNRLFLKYAGIDYEFYNRSDLRYRSTAT